MDPEHLWAVGYAQYRPNVDNVTEANRQANRRVVLMIRPNTKKPGESKARPAVDDQLNTSRLREPAAPAVDLNIEPYEQLSTDTDTAKVQLAPIQLPAPIRQPLQGNRLGGQ